MFLSSVRAHRVLKGDVTGTLSGAMFMAKDAKARGLIDDIGGQKTALAWLSHSLKYKETPGHLSRLDGKAASKSAAKKVPAYQLTPLYLKLEAKRKEAEAKKNRPDSEKSWMQRPINQRFSSSHKNKK
jgi:ClpP class serine protease